MDLEAAFRIHKELRPKSPRRYRSGRFRFDAPAGQFKVTYVSANRYACFAEVFGNTGIVPPDAGSRYLSQLVTDRPLQLLDLVDETVWPCFGLDGQINCDIDYSMTQAWSLVWHSWYPKADGIQYPGRRAGLKLNYCLFLDRCGDSIAFRRLGRLAELTQTVRVAAERYALKNMLPARSVAGPLP